jgi:hypothetical protein
LPPVHESGTWYEGPLSFTDWPGAWGVDENLEAHHVTSPAAHWQFDEPWVVTECDDEGEGCDKEEKPSSRSFMQQDRSSEKEDIPATCMSWFGAEVSALLCSPPRLDDTLKDAAIGSRRGSATITVVHGKRHVDGATSGGLVQVGGQPLVPGDRVVISGNVGKDAVLVLRSITKAGMTETTYRASGSGIPAEVVIRDEPSEDGKGRIAVPEASSGQGEPIEPVGLSTAVYDE